MLQTADAIVSEAVSQAASAAGDTYLEKTTQYQSASSIVTEAVRVSGQNADLKYLESLGVVELTPPRDSAPTLQASPEPPQKSSADGKPKTAKRRAVKKESDATATETVQTDSPKASPKKSTPDAVLSSLTPIQLAVLQAIPDDRAITADSLGNLGYPYGDTVAALTMLEILGLIQKLPGALYTKS